MKRSKNIFNSPIAHQSLLQQEENRQFQIQNRSVVSNWLIGIPPHLYRRYIVSALHMSVLQKELDDLREANDNKQFNLFKIGKMKKKMDNLELLQIEDEKKQITDASLEKNEPPQTDNIIVHKMSTGFFKSLLQRKCRIVDKELQIETFKSEQQKWIQVGMQDYTIQLQEKEKPLNKEQFKQFQWRNEAKQRLLLYSSKGKDRKPYCLYGNQVDLKKFQRYFQVQNIEVKQLSIFKLLNSQFQQKNITLFGNKVRFYDHYLKVRKAQKDAQLLSIHALQKQLSIQDAQANRMQEIKQKRSQPSSEMGVLSDISQSGFLQPQKQTEEHVKHSDKIRVSAINLEDSLKNIAKVKTHEKERKSESQVFRLKVKSSTVFYNQIEDPIQFDEKEREAFSITDLKLNLKDGISQVDQQSEHKSVVFSQTLSGKKRVKKMTLENAMDKSEKFNINIYEVGSYIDSQRDNQSERRPSSPHQSMGSVQQFMKELNENEEEFRRHNSLRISHISEMKRPDKAIQRKLSQVDSLADYFQLEKVRPSDEDQSGGESGNSNGIARVKVPSPSKADKENFLIRNFKKKRINEVDIIMTPRKEETHFAVTQIKMMMPYHSAKMHFQILQLEPQLELQKKIVACGSVQGVFTQKIEDGQRYMHYTKEGGLHFKMSKDSNYFVFILQQESKCHYINFQVDPVPKYQKNYSQLLKTQLDKQGYPFAICLVLYASPNPVVIPSQLNTIKFLRKYLSQGQNYDFKHDFIDDKRRIQSIKKQWNKVHIKHAVLAGDYEAFSKSVFLGLSDSIFRELKKKVEYDPKKLFNLTENESRLIQQNVLINLLDLKSFLKPAALVHLIMEAPFNQALKERLEQVYVFCLHRYNSVRNLALIFTKVILDKLEPLLVLCRRQEEVIAIIHLYAEVQYEINQLFMEMSRYFKN